MHQCTPSRGLSSTRPPSVGVAAAISQLRGFWLLVRTMAGPPDIRRGDYVITRESPTGPVCRAYSEPPSIGCTLFHPGQKIVTIAPGTYLGPVEETLFTGKFLAILVRTYWINVWKARGCRGGGAHFARRVESPLVQQWRDRGWCDDVAP